MTFNPSTTGARNLICSVSSASKTQYNTTLAQIIGSSIDYTPAPNCQIVEYRFQCLANYSPEANDLLQFSLMYDDTVALDPETEILSFTELVGGQSGWGGNANSQSGLLNLRFSIPSWGSAQRRLVVACRAYTNSLQGTLHWTDQFREDDVDAALATDDSFKFSPHLIVYSL